MKQDGNYFVGGKWILAGLLKIIENLFGERKQFPSIFYGNDLFNFYTTPGFDLDHWRKQCEKIIIKNNIKGKFNKFLMKSTIFLTQFYFT